MKSKDLVTVIIASDAAPVEMINGTIKNVLGQTYKNLEIFLTLPPGRPENEKIRNEWSHIPNFYLVESKGITALTYPLTKASGKFIFYRTVSYTSWLPRHIEHHVELFNFDEKAKWSFSHLEFKNMLEREHPLSIVNWRVETSPDPKTIVIDELCHRAEVTPSWEKCLVSIDGGKTVGFFPGEIFSILKDFRVATPEEITVQVWIDPRPPLPEFGKPVSTNNVDEKVSEDADGQLSIEAEFPTIVGSSQWEEHNKIVWNRIKDVDPTKIKKIAVKRTIGMGDVILSEPIIKVLRTKYPNAEIHYFTSNQRSCADIVHLFKNKPNVVVPMEGEGTLTQDYLYTQKGFDLRIDLDLSYESRKNVNYIDAYFYTAGFKPEVQEVDGKLRVVSPVLEEQKVPELVYEEPRMIKDKYVSVELGGSGWPGKEWNPENWKKVLAEVSSMSYTIAFVSNQTALPGNLISPEFEPVTLMNSKNDFNTMLNYLRYADFHIGADNGPMHIAAAFGKKCFVVAGAALPTYTTKNPNVYQCVHPTLSCLHCKGRQFFNRTDQGFTFVANCENPDQFACMRKLETNHVLSEFKRFYEAITT